MDGGIHCENPHGIAAAESCVDPLRVKDSIGRDDDGFGDGDGADGGATVKTDCSSGAERQTEARKVATRNQDIEEGRRALKVNAARPRADGKRSAGGVELLSGL